jgi:hypothetical protein
MELSPDPARAQAHYAMIHVPETAAFWLSCTTHHGHRVEGWTTRILPLPPQAEQGP